MATKIFTSRTDCLYDDQRFDDFYNSIPSVFQSKIDAKKQRKDKNLSLGAYFLLYNLLRKEGLNDFKIEYADNGKPYLTGNNSLYLNISHSEDVVLCAISDGEVGCDVEKVRNVNFNIVNRCFSSEEMLFFDSLKTFDEKKDIFFRLWTLKESYIKMLGDGLRIPLNEVSFDLSGNNPVLKDNSGLKCRFEEFDLNDGYKYAVCCQSPVDDIVSVDIKDLM